ncbi:hypothetical protein D3C80_1724620 [compost metagenome]
MLHQVSQHAQLERQLRGGILGEGVGKLALQARDRDHDRVHGRFATFALRALTLVAALRAGVLIAALRASVLVAALRARALAATRRARSFAAALRTRVFLGGRLFRRLLGDQGPDRG